MTIYAKILLAILTISLAFLSGWKVEYWHYSSEQNKAVNKSLADFAEKQDQLIAAHNKEVSEFNTRNDETTGDQLKTQLLLKEQNDAIAKLQYRVGRIKVGSCTFNGDADSLLKRAYQSAIPDPTQ